MVSRDCGPTSASRTRRSSDVSGASHVEHLGKSRYSIVHRLGHTCRFICARRRRRRARRRFGRNGTFRRGPAKRCYNWRGGNVGRPERNRKRFQGSPNSAAAHKRPDDSAVQVIAERLREAIQSCNQGLDCLVAALLAMTTTCESAISRRDAPESCMDPSPRKTEGVGNAGCPLHPQPRVQWWR